mmetsp:Transcript_90230/g.184007  ORF Transcript_90230/g.184007 Transcript_90230/m.184007 type:complete len:247 (+) Transcript_90230:232-972(+)
MPSTRTLRRWCRPGTKPLCQCKVSCSHPMWTETSQAQRPLSRPEKASAWAPAVAPNARGWWRGEGPRARRRWRPPQGHQSLPRRQLSSGGCRCRLRPHRRSCRPLDAGCSQLASHAQGLPGPATCSEKGCAARRRGAPRLAAAAPTRRRHRRYASAATRASLRAMAGRPCEGSRPAPGGGRRNSGSRPKSRAAAARGWSWRCGLRPHPAKLQPRPLGARGLRGSAAPPGHRGHNRGGGKGAVRCGG